MILASATAEAKERQYAGTATDSRTSRMSFSEQCFKLSFLTLLTHDRLDKKDINVPVLFIQATKDDALPPAMSEGMEQHIPNLTRKSVDTSHWALWEAPKQVNHFIKEWLGSVDKPRSAL